MLWQPAHSRRSLAAHTTGRGDALGALGNVGGVHGPFERDELAFGLALDRVTAATGHGIARVVAGFTGFDLFLVDKVVEHHGFHARTHGTGL